MKPEIYYAVNDAIVEAEAKAGRPFHDFDPDPAFLDSCKVCQKTDANGNHWDYDEPEFEEE